MSDKAQTTLNKIMGIYTITEQIVFIDTPGFANPRQRLETSWWMAYTPFEKWISFFYGAGGWATWEGIIERLKAAKVPVILVVTKIDKVHPDQSLAQIDDFRSQMDFKEIVPISALQGNNVSRLIDILSENLEEGFQYFLPTKSLITQERFLVSEMIREKVLHLHGKKFHSVAVVVIHEAGWRDSKAHIRSNHHGRAR